MASTNMNSNNRRSRSASKTSERSKQLTSIGMGLLGRQNSASSGKQTAEKRRTKAAEKAPARKSSVARQPKSTSTPPPVMARSYNMELPFVAEKSYTKKNRRRVDVPLSVPGAEIRLPAIPTFRFSVKWLALLVIVVLLGGLYFLYQAPFFQVVQPDIQGLKRVRPSDVNALLGVEGKPIFSVRPAKLEAKLLAAFPEFAAVHIQTALPHEMSINVTERVPVLTWRQGAQTQLVDANGYIFPLRLDASHVISPVVEAAGSPPLLAKSAEEILSTITHNVDSQSQDIKTDANTVSPTVAKDTTASGQFLEPAMVKAILSISTVVPTNSMLVYDPKHGFGWDDQRGWKVYLGDDQDMDMKLNLYQDILKQLEIEQIQPVLISVEHVHNPYYRLQQ